MGIFLRSLLCVSLILLSASASEFKKGKLSGTVTDSEGGVISGAIVIIHWDSVGSTVGVDSNVGLSEDIRLQTDKTGAYSVDIPPGFYDVFVSALAFSPSCRKVRVQSDGMGKFSPKLNLDPVVSRELKCASCI
jgi:hypothetical protein